MAPLSDGGMANDPWRRAVARWGTQVFQLALLATGGRKAAHTALLNSFHRVFTGPQPDHVELALYSALAGELHRRDVLRRSRLPPELRHHSPVDRWLLGLWLLHDLHGQHLVAVTGLAPDALLERLSAALTRTFALDERPLGNVEAALKSWLAGQLKLDDAAGGERGTISTPIAVLGQQQVERLRSMIAVAVGRQVPSSQVFAELEIRIATSRGSVSKWYDPRRVVPLMLVAATLLLCASLVLPRRSADGSKVAPSSPSLLVQETLQAWTGPTTAGVLHQQVRALDMRQSSGIPLVTDVWLSAAGASRHRVEVHQGSRLVEWQVGDGVKSLSYGATPGYSSCPWQMDPSDNRSSVLSFMLVPEQQRSVRDARLMQGAFGTGYRVLMDALSASDLRSFGTRREGETRVIILGYTDQRSASKRRIMLSIDPASRQLHMVQAVSSESGQTRTEELWRLLTRHESEADVPAGLPQRSEHTYSSLLDPSCPALQSHHVQSLQSLVGTPWQQWFLPRRIPADITRAAIIEAAPYLEAELRSDTLIGTSAQFVGAGRWLGLSAGNWLPNASGLGDVQRGQWRVALREAGSSGTWHATLRQTRERFSPPFVLTVSLAAVGWTRDELLRFVDSLAALDLQEWLDLAEHFVDPNPLAMDAQRLIRLASSALRLPADGAVHTATRTTFRVPPAGHALSDPYHMSRLVREPESLDREQWQVLSGGEITRFSDVFRAADGSLYQATLDDSSRSIVDYRAEGWIGIEETDDLHGADMREQPGVEMLSAFLRDAVSVTVTRQGDQWMLAHAAPDGVPGVGYEFFSRELPSPWTEDLMPVEIVRRLWLDASTYMPRQLEIASRDDGGVETPLSRTTVVDRRLVDQAPLELLTAPSPSDDVLVFNSTAPRWRRARVAFPPLVNDWLEASFDNPEVLIRPDDRLVNDSMQHVLAWPDSTAVDLNWKLIPVTPPSELTLSSIRTNTWHSLGRLPVAHRAEYRIPAYGVEATLTQGPAPLLRHILRYPPRRRDGSVSRWNDSRQLLVTIAGQQREAWLLQDAQFAVLVCEVDGLLVHIRGPAGYLQGALLEQLPLLTWSPVSGE